MKARAVIFGLLAVSGFILSTLGLISFPLFHNVNYFWPAAVVQAVGAVLFGWTGILAGTVFPIFSNWATDKSLVSVFLFIPSNFLQSYLPYLLYNRLAKDDIAITSARDGLSFSLFAAVIPQLCGGALAGGILCLIGQLKTRAEFLKMVSLWFVDSVPWIIVVGIPIMMIFVPVLKDYGCLFGLQDRRPAQTGMR